MHAFAQQRGLRAKTDQVDAATIARALLSGEARFGYVPSEQVETYRELMPYSTNRVDDVVRYKIEIHALLVVLFPECTRVFVDHTSPTALLVPQAISECTSHRADGRGDAEYVLTRTGAAPLRAVNRASVGVVGQSVDQQWGGPRSLLVQSASSQRSNRTFPDEPVSTPARGRPVTGPGPQGQRYAERPGM